MVVNKYTNKEGKERIYIYTIVRPQSIRRGTVNGKRNRGKKGRITLPLEFIGKRVKVEIMNKTKGTK